MSRVMYDSVNVNSLPAGAPLYGAYVDGWYKNEAAVRSRFPKARIVTITVKGGTTDADVVDCENGDTNPTTAAQWAANQIHRGKHPTIYCSLSIWGEVKAAVAARGLAGKVSYWIAHYDGISTIPAGAVAVQYLGDYHGYDKSAVGSYWPGVDPAIRKVLPGKKPAPKPAPQPTHVRVKNPFPEPTTVVKEGDKGESVKWVQWAINEKVDGVFGAHTKAGVAQFQKAHKLAVDGIVGPKTKAELAKVTK